MIGKGTQGVVVEYNGVEFLIYRNDADHYLKYQPTTITEAYIVAEFNDLMDCCRAELSKELEQSNMNRLVRDDNEGDPIK